MRLIPHCCCIDSVRGFVECYGVLEMSLAIALRYPIKYPDPPECDMGALLHLRSMIVDIGTNHYRTLPTSQLDDYISKVVRLLTVYQAPRKY